MRAKKRRVSVTIKLSAHTPLALDTIRKRVLDLLVTQHVTARFKEQNFDYHHVKFIRADVD